MAINLSENFTYKKLIKFTLPTIIMMIFTSIYGVVDGLFVSNVVGSDAFAAINLIMPAIMIIGMVAFILQNSFQSFMVVAEKPKFGLGISISAGVTNMVLDFVFIYVFKWGVKGAAIATVISQVVGAAIPLVYFFRKNDTMLKLGKTKFELSPILKTCINGSSEMVTNLSMSLVNILFNMQLMEFAGADGVSAYGIIMYVGFLFVGTYVGYSVGSAPIISYHYGAGNKEELKSLFKKSLKLLGIVAIVMTALSEILAKPLASVFVSYDKELLALTIKAIRLYALSYILSWFNIFASSFFTALNDGFVSALISFLRTLVFQVIMILVLPKLLELNGVWLSVVFAEVLATVVSIICYIKNRKKYEYI